MPTLSFISLKLKLNSVLSVYTEDLWYPRLSLIDIHTGNTAVVSTDMLHSFLWEAMVTYYASHH